MEKGPHIAITGASSGIGAALALAYAGPGVRLSLQGRDAGRLNQVCQQASAKGAMAHPVCLDVTDSDSVTTWIQSADAIQPIDLFIANAGIAANSLADDDGLAITRRIFATNFDGMLSGLHAVLPLMKKRGAGQVALVSSLASFRGAPKAGAYCASKAAVRLYGEALRPELAADGIKLSVVCPGFVKTPLTDQNNFSMPFLMTPEQAARVIQKGLACNRGRIAFPWPMRILVAIYTALSCDWVERCIAKLPSKNLAEK